MTSFKKKQIKFVQKKERQNENINLFTFDSTYGCFFKSPDSSEQG